MTIYPSTKVLPYVYRLDHPVTGEFYIGYRSANKFPSSSDIGIKYFTSSKVVKPRFNEFIITIIAEFFEPSSAYDFEQGLIHESLKNYLILNRICHHKGEKRFKTDKGLGGVKKGNIPWNKGLTKSTDKRLKDAGEKIAISKLGSHHTKEHCDNISKGHVGKSQATIKVCRIKDRKVMNLSNFKRSINGKKYPPSHTTPHTEEAKQKMRKKKSNTKNMATSIRCCRISDHKEMPVPHFYRYIK